jgi:hypothetical protein
VSDSTVDRTKYMWAGFSIMSVAVYPVAGFHFGDGKAPFIRTSSLMTGFSS